MPELHEPGEVEFEGGGRIESVRVTEFDPENPIGQCLSGLSYMVAELLKQQGIKTMVVPVREVEGQVNYAFSRVGDQYIFDLEG